MKKFIAFALSIITLAAFICGCKQNEVELDVFEAGNALLEKCTFETHEDGVTVIKPDIIDGEHALKLFGIDSALVMQRDLKHQVFACVRADNPETILVIEANSAADAKTISSGAIEATIKSYKEDSIRYGQEDMVKINGCINRVVGRYVFLIICSDNTSAKKVLDGIVSEASK